MNPADTIVHSLTATKLLLNRYVADLKPEEYLHRPCTGGNCVAWIVGHLVLTERMAIKLLGVEEMPELPAGFEAQFAREGEAWKAEEFGDVTKLLLMFNEHRERTIAAVNQAAPEQLSKLATKEHPLYRTVGEQVNFLAMHSCMHAGQITIIRRSLGRPPLV